MLAITSFLPLYQLNPATWFFMHLDILHLAFLQTSNFSVVLTFWRQLLLSLSLGAAPSSSQWPGGFRGQQAQVRNHQEIATFRLLMLQLFSWQGYKRQPGVKRVSSYLQLLESPCLLLTFFTPSNSHKHPSNVWCSDCSDCSPIYSWLSQYCGVPC